MHIVRQIVKAEKKKGAIVTASINVSALFQEKKGESASS